MYVTYRYVLHILIRIRLTVFILSKINRCVYMNGTPLDS